ncbi:MAG TPA: hypothetical protein VNS32_27415 [Flavisolibacter sp.]|nr:hypothetical protein [Flavisolibacter sp.]
MKKVLSQFEVWAQLRVSKKSTQGIHDFFRSEYRIAPEFLIPNLHITVYHSRRPMFGLTETERACHLFVDTYDTRFMVLAPGGENPRPGLIPSKRKVGIRIKRDSPFRQKIYDYRNILLPYETSRVLGTRKPSSKSINAFGARNFQPHIALLKAGSGIPTILTEVGENFRETIPEIYFDKFIIETKKNF